MAGVVILAFLVPGTPKPKPDEFYRDGDVEIPEYRVTYDDRGWRCTCPQWIYRLSKSKGKCKHIEQCLPELRRHQEIISWWRQSINEGELSPEDRLELLEG